MSNNIYKTSKGASVDMSRLKLLNETVVAVGNAGTNARGDVVKGGKIIKTREEITQENYNLRGNNFKKNSVVHDSIDSIPVEQQTEVGTVNPYNAVTSDNVQTTTVNQNELGEQPRGGLANAISKSKEISDILNVQRKRI